VEGARWKVSGGRWKVPGGRCQVEGGRCQVEGVRWKVSGGRWKVSGVRWKVEGPGDSTVFYNTPSIPYIHFNMTFLPNFTILLRNLEASGFNLSPESLCP
jgi:hypothetical protein